MEEQLLTEVTEVDMAEFQDVVERLRSTPVIREPFPHLDIRGLFSPSYFDEVMRELPPLSDDSFQRAGYAGHNVGLDLIDFPTASPGTTVHFPEDSMVFRRVLEGARGYGYILRKERAEALFRLNLESFKSRWGG